MTENRNSLPNSITELLSQFQTYAKARGQFLELINRGVCINPFNPSKVVNRNHFVQLLAWLMARK